jgi:iron complex outermembrane receptor protein
MAIRPGVLARRLLLAGVAYAAPTIPAAAAPAAAAAAPAAATIAEGGDEVTVTARYRDENLQNVPIAVSAISAAQIQSVGNAYSLKTLQGYLPSLQIQGYSARNQTITIRGLGTNSGQTNEGLDQGVGLYIDGVYYARTGTALSDLVDVASIQVLRGPQGTLFGKNTVAGAVDIRSRLPSFDPEISGTLTVGNYHALRTQVSASAGLTDTIAVRLSYSGNRRNGLIWNRYRNESWDNLKSDTFRADIVYRPGPNTRIRLIGDYSEQTGNIGFTSTQAVLPTTRADNSVVRGFYDRARDIGYVPGPIDPFSREVEIDQSHHQRLRTGGVSGKIEQDIGDLTLTSLTAYRFWNYEPRFDGDMTAADVSRRSTVAPRQRQFSQELRATGKAGRIDYTAGLYYFWQISRAPGLAIYGKDAAKWYLGATAPDAILEGVEGRSFTDPQTRSYAAFGQATWHATDALSLTGGLRYTREKKSGSYSATIGGDYVPIASLPTAWQAAAVSARNTYAPVGGDYEASRTKGNLSWLATAGYDLSDRIHSYASYSRGYKSAGINLVRQTAGVNIFVAPEKVDAYEIGLKSQFLGQALTVNTALFWTDVTNFQSNIYDVEKRVSYIGNVGKVRSRGVEIDARLVPLTGLTLSAAGTYTDAKYVSYPNAICPFALSYKSYCDISGQRLTGVSKWAASLWGEYERPVSDRLAGYAGFDVTYRSRYFSTVNDDPYGEIAGYALVGLHAGIRPARGPWDISLWVRNLTDKNYYNNLAVNTTTGLVQSALGEPRTYGATLRVRF